MCVNFFCQGDYNDDGDNDDVEEEEGIMIVTKMVMIIMMRKGSDFGRVSAIWCPI